MIDDYVGSGPSDYTEARCRHCRQVIVISDDRDTLIKTVVMHMTVDHKAGSGLLVEAPTPDAEGDFETGPSHWRCDLCFAVTERPFWQFHTPSTAEQSFQDEGWLVCDECQKLVETRNIIGLTRRAMTINQAELGASREEVLRGVVPHLRIFLSTYDPRQTRRIA